MKLNQIVTSTDWNDQLKEEFLIKLRKAKSDYNKAQDCNNKAYNMRSKHPDEAIELLDYAIKNFGKDKFSLARLYSTKGRILEYYKQNYLEAYVNYTKWAAQNSIFGGHFFDRTRALLRYNKLEANDELIKLCADEKEKVNPLPTRNVRFWLFATTSALYEHDGLEEKSKEFAKKALEVYNEQGQSQLNKEFNKLNILPDNIGVTDEEINILKQRVFT